MDRFERERVGWGGGVRVGGEGGQSELLSAWILTFRQPHSAHSRRTNASSFF